MIEIKIRDKMVVHAKSFFKNTDKMQLAHTDVDQIVHNDIVLYTDQNANEFHVQARKRIMLLLESPEYHHHYYEYVCRNIHKYDLILTFHKPILEENLPNVKFNVYGTTWIHEDYRRVYKKSKMCSTIASNKRITSGHRMRHNMIDMILQKQLPFGLYGGRFQNLPQMVRSRESDHECNGKILALGDYRFSLTIENCREDYYFTEKLIDCFLTGTVPIYWGCPSIGNFFNTKGMICFMTEAHGMSILPTLTAELYESMLPYIQENFQKAFRYVTFSLNEEAILECCSHDSER